MSRNHKINCWQCSHATSLEERREFDGCCWGCGAEIDLEGYLIKAMDERDQHLAALPAVTAERDQLRAELDELALKFAASDYSYDQSTDQLRAEVEANKWIPLSEATPPDGVPVLRWPGWAAEISIDEWCDDYGCFLMSIEEGERATHWKPISAPAAMAAKEGR